MERDPGSWLCSDWILSNLNVHRGQKNVVPDYKKPFCNMVFTDGLVPMFSKGSTFASLPMGGNCKQLGDANKDPGCVKKRFVVFDQSGDQTALIFSSGSGIDASPNYLPSWRPNAFDWDKECGMKGDKSSAPVQFSDDENGKEDVVSEMHEDTEELNALLYSDDENDFGEDDEVTSTGHSPCDKQESVEECGVEVDSSASPIKRQKLSNGDYKVPLFMDSKSSEDAESSCGNGQNQVLEESDSISGNKRSRIEKIRETVGILQGIIPRGTVCKDAIGVFDEAICYLRSLKVNAKALGLDSP